MIESPADVRARLGARRRACSITALRAPVRHWISYPARIIESLGHSESRITVMELCLNFSSLGTKGTGGLARCAQRWLLFCARLIRPWTRGRGVTQR